MLSSVAKAGVAKARFKFITVSHLTDSPFSSEKAR
jgi:hypothetical protein